MAVSLTSFLRVRRTRCSFQVFNREQMKSNLKYPNSGALEESSYQILDKMKILSLVLCKNTGRFNGSAHQDQFNENIMRFTRNPKTQVKNRYSWENGTRYDVTFQRHAIAADYHAR